jgi:hypothetical protein
MGMSCENDGLFPLGTLVLIKRGKHTDSIFAVVGIDKNDGKILLADGIRISAKKPKRKSSRHIEGMNAVLGEVEERLVRGKFIDDGWLNEIISRRRAQLVLEEVGRSYAQR